MFLLDTNVVSELRKIPSGRANAEVAAWAASERVADFFLSVLTLMEIEIGVLRIERRDPEQGARLRAWLERQVKAAFRGRLLPVDDAVGLRCARLHVPDPRSERDALIAATALEHGLTVVTRNVGDFVGMSVAVFNPWQAKDPG